MIVFRLHGETEPVLDSVHVQDQTELMSLVDVCGLSQVVHYRSANTIATVYYQPSTNAVSHMCILLRRSASAGRLSISAAQGIARWTTEHQTTEGYAPLRSVTPGVQSTPNAGTNRTVEELNAWCDMTVDAVTHYLVVSNPPCHVVCK